MSKGVYSVQTIDRRTGAENWVRVEAADREDAATQVADLGEVVGEVRLVEVLPAPDQRPKSSADPADLKGFSVEVRREGQGGTTWEYIEGVDEADSCREAEVVYGEGTVLSVVEMGRRLGRQEVDRKKQRGLSCPKCSALAAGGYGVPYWLIGILFFPIGLLVFLIKPSYPCRKCGFSFKS